MQEKSKNTNTNRPAGKKRPAGYRKLLALLLVLAIALLSTAGCSTNQSSDNIPDDGTTRATNQTSKTTGSNTTAPSQTSGSGEPTKELVIVTSVYPLYLAAAQVARGVNGVSVRNLTESITGCLHDYQLTTANMKTLELADAFIINGAGLEDYLETIARDLPNLQIIEAAEGIALTDENPHVWVSISLMMQQVENITREIIELDPANRESFVKNAEDYLARLETLRQKMHTSIDPLPQRKIITVHEAFPYFASEFSLEIAGVIEREPDSEPSAAEMAATIDLIKAQKVSAVFAEPQYPKATAELIAAEAGARFYTLDPVASGDLNNLDGYLEAMEKNRLVLMEALK